MSRDYFAQTPENLVTSQCPECGGREEGYPVAAIEDGPGVGISGLWCSLVCLKCGAKGAVIVPHPDYPEFSRKRQLDFLGVPK